MELMVLGDLRSYLLEHAVHLRRTRFECHLLRVVHESDMGLPIVGSLPVLWSIFLRMVSYTVTLQLATYSLLHLP